MLLIRHSYLPQWWSLPGGKVKKGESPKETVVREVVEEIGTKIIPEFLTTVYSDREYKKVTIHLYTAHVDRKSIEIDEVEIDEAEWFSKNNLPKNLGWLARQAVSALQSQEFKNS